MEGSDCSGQSIKIFAFAATVPSDLALEKIFMLDWVFNTALISAKVLTPHSESQKPTQF
jgi:hypothetical protein